MTNRQSSIGNSPEPPVHVAALARFGTALLVGLLCTAPAAAGDWDGGGDGVSWTNGPNWNPDGVPAAADAAVINKAGAAVTLGGGATNQAASLAVATAGVSAALSIAGSSTVLSLNGGGMSLATANSSSAILSLADAEVINVGGSEWARRGGTATVTMTNSAIRILGGLAWAGGNGAEGADTLNLTMVNSLIDVAVGSVTVGNARNDQKADISLDASSRISIPYGNLTLNGGNPAAGGGMAAYALPFAPTPAGTGVFFRSGLTVAGASNNKVMLSATHGPGHVIRPTGSLSVGTGASARGELVADGAFDFGDSGSAGMAAGSAGIVSLAEGGYLGVADTFTLRGNATASGTVQGQGTFNGGNTLNQNGRVVADGGVLYVDHGSLTQNQEGYGVSMGDGTLAGWYAVNGGKLALKGLDVTGPVAWGDTPGDGTRTEADPVNSVYFTWTGLGSGKLHGGVAAPALATGLENAIGLWEFNPAAAGGMAFTDATVTFRYDSARAVALGIETNLNVYQLQGDAWVNVTAVTNTTARQLTTIALSALGNFAVATGGGAGTGVTVPDCAGTRAQTACYFTQAQGNWATNSHWSPDTPQARDVVYIGYSAPGVSPASVTLDDGTALAVSTVNIGRNGRRGALAVIGPDTLLRATGGLTMAYQDGSDGGNATLTVTNAAQLVVEGALNILNNNASAWATLGVDASSVFVLGALNGGGRGFCTTTLALNHGATLDVAGMNLLTSDDGGRGYVSALNGSVLNCRGGMSIGRAWREKVAFDIDAASQVIVAGDLRIVGSDAADPSGFARYVLPLASTPGAGRFALGGSVYLCCEGGAGGGTKVALMVSAAHGAPPSTSLAGSLSMSTRGNGEQSAFALDGTAVAFAGSITMCADNSSAAITLANSAALSTSGSLVNRAAYRGLGIIQGNGALTVAGQLRNDGRIVADGGTLTVSWGSLGQQWAGADLDLLDGTFQGWYAVNRGRLVLPDLGVSGTATWGDANATLDMVNSVRMTSWTGLTAGTLRGALLATNNPAVIPGLVKPVGVWQFARGGSLAFDSVEMTFRYDHLLAAAVGVRESDLKLFRAGSRWTRLDAVVDAGTHTITAAGVTALGQFAVAERALDSGALLLLR